jgi:hypothetical protein
MPFLSHTSCGSRPQQRAYGYLRHRHPLTQRLHPHYRILGTVGGRFNCSNPNIQQSPTDTELRQLVRADPGRLLVCADYSQIELRIAALLSQDALLLAAYANGADLHAQTATALCGDGTRRQLGKCANFGLLYGSGAAGLQAFAKSSYGVEMTLQEAAQHPLPADLCRPAAVAAADRPGGTAFAKGAHPRRAGSGAGTVPHDRSLEHAGARQRRGSAAGGTRPATALAAGAGRATGPALPR